MVTVNGDKLVFNLAGKYIGIDVKSIKGIVDVDRFFSVPISSPAVKGVINHQGEIIPVAEIAVLLRFNTVSESPFRVVIVKVDDTLLGISIAVKDTYFLWKGEVTPENLKPIEGERYFKAVIETNGKKIKLLDLKAVTKSVENITKGHNSAFSGINSQISNLKS